MISLKKKILNDEREKKPDTNTIKSLFAVKDPKMAREISRRP